MNFDVISLYRQSAANFGEEVALIGDEEWDLPTPCPEWIVKAVVAHVVLGEAQVPDLIAGNSFDLGDIDASVLGHDPLSVWRGTAVAALNAVTDVDLDMLVSHPVGRLPLNQVVWFRITENLVHAWDIATARGLGHELDPEIATACLDFWLPLVDALASSGYFAPMLEPSSSASGVRLLALLGRG